MCLCPLSLLCFWGGVSQRCPGYPPTPCLSSSASQGAEISGLNHCAFFFKEERLYDPINWCKSVWEFNIPSWEKHKQELRENFLNLIKSIYKILPLTSYLMVKIECFTPKFWDKGRMSTLTTLIYNILLEVLGSDDVII